MSGLFGGDWLRLFETQPLEDMLAEIAAGWNKTQQSAGKLKASLPVEVVYVL